MSSDFTCRFLEMIDIENDELLLTAREAGWKLDLQCNKFNQVILRATLISMMVQKSFFILKKISKYVLNSHDGAEVVSWQM